MNREAIAPVIATLLLVATATAKNNFKLIYEK